MYYTDWQKRVDPSNITRDAFSINKYAFVSSLAVVFQLCSNAIGNVTSEYENITKEQWIFKWSSVVEALCCVWCDELVINFKKFQNRAVEDTND